VKYFCSFRWPDLFDASGAQGILGLEEFGYILERRLLLYMEKRAFGWKHLPFYPRNYNKRWLHLKKQDYVVQIEKLRKDNRPIKKNVQV